MRSIRHVHSILPALLLLLGLPALASEHEAWTPDGPAMPDTFDWVRLPSGEWLAGTVEVLYDGALEFDSEELDDVTIDWEDVQELRTVQVLEVRTIEQQVATGRVFITDGKVQVLGDQPAEFDQENILTITTGAARERDHWSGFASASANARSGNTDQTDINVQAGVKRRTTKQRIAFDYISNYSNTDDQETANNQRLNGNWDRFVNGRLYITPLFGEYYSDAFRNIDHRFTLGAGVGYQIIDTSRSEWTVTAGPAYQETWFDDVPAGEKESESSPAFSASTHFDYEVTSNIDFLYNYRFQITNKSNGRYSHHMEAGISIDLIGDLDLKVTGVWDRTEVPQPDSDGTVPEPDDVQLLLGLGYTF